jgi:hypothetical protein
MSILLLLCSQQLSAQRQLKNYAVRNGKMYIELGKDLSERTIDSFIVQFNLSDIGLKQFIRKNNPDSILKSGWTIEMNNEVGVIISKQLMALDIDNPADKIIFAEKHPTLAEMFPAVNNGIQYGYNRFRNAMPFAVSDSTVNFFLRNNIKAERVMLAGSFNNWSPQALSMNRTDSGWIAQVKLGPGKYWYKFIVDGRWMTDNDNLVKENDGLGNTNSVFYRPNVLFALDGFTNARKVFLSGSFNNWRPSELQMIKSAHGWELPLYLAEGTHTYKFVIDGQWKADQKNPDRLPDGHGDFNSVLSIGKPYVFKLNDYSNASQVFLSGSFNGWREDELLMNKTAKGWELPYTLGPGNYEYKFRVDGKWIADPSTSASSENNNSYLIIQPNYTFRLKGFGNAKTIYLAGDFNDWNPSSFAMKKQGDEWVFSVHLSTGKHRYKFIVDGKWIIDPSNKLWEQNEYGTGNSVIWIGREVNSER